ncbi:glycosyltransferase family 2 protein [Streptomyces tubercidicus]|uniref:glycosyltransferase family 2 protein n=1 Tax=Streptomyces tubercidicus TaxID=47759 RepID=UPI002E103672|nr:glycosyltransferase family 2 protein [Streptomyces tubercidicus]WSX25156.1 glycosyltransferase family 2 protein [Streptomyces tubercidicus]
MKEALEPLPGPTITPSAQVSIVVIAFNDVAHIGDAVRSALAQGTPGETVTEVIAVNDASTDGTGAALDDLARTEPRLRVLHRDENSGGCGTPRNDGLRAATGRFVMFLDSDDVLPPGAARALLAAALEHDAPVAAGACVRRELPAHRDVPWLPGLYREPAVHEAPDASPQLVRDTLCVNKLYERAFLDKQAITFPEGRFTYEDFVFTARVLAAAPRIATIPDRVYVWHVRRSATRQSISLDRKDVANWQARIAAHRASVRIFQEAGQQALAQAARTKFLDHDLRMYVRELHTRGADYRAEWWRLTREYLAGFEEAELRAARAPARWLARVVLASPAPRDLGRLTQLAARPGRLLPPYAEAGGRAVWSGDLPEVELDAIGTKPMHRLPVTIDAEPAAGSPGVLRLRVHDLYGRLAAAGPVSIDIELRRRRDDRRGPVHTAALTPAPASGGSESCWTAEIVLDLGALVERDGAHRADPEPWDLMARVSCKDGAGFRAALRAVGPGLRRRVLPSRRHVLLLVQPYATTGGALSLRVASGLRSVWRIAARRLRG